VTGDEQHLTRARTGAITGAVVAIMLVVFSLFVLFWPDGNDDSLVTSPVARELTDPSIVPTPTPLPSPTPTPTPRAGPPVAAGTSWYNAPAAAREWKPPVIRGPAVAELIIVNEVTDSPGQTIEYADNAAGRRWVASGEAVAAQIRDGEVLVVQNTPSGWPDPEIQCDGGNPFVSGSRVLLTTAAGQRVTCAFRNTPTSARHRGAVQPPLPLVSRWGQHIDTHAPSR